MFSTMSYIQKTVKNKDKKNKSKIERSFEIHCVMKNFEVSNDLLRRRHPGMFKNNDFYFCPTNELVKSMPFDFVNGLKDGKWTKLDNKWLKDVKKTLHQRCSLCAYYHESGHDFDGFQRVQQRRQPYLSGNNGQ